MRIMINDCNSSDNIILDDFDEDYIWIEIRDAYDRLVAIPQLRKEDITRALIALGLKDLE